MEMELVLCCAALASALASAAGVFEKTAFDAGAGRAS